MKIDDIVKIQGKVVLIGKDWIKVQFEGADEEYSDCLYISLDKLPSLLTEPLSG